jgi:hypothetical protein
VKVLEAEALVALASAHVAADRFEEAGSELAEAVELAERLGERRVLWEALALSAIVQDRKGADRESTELRRRAREIVDEIAAGLTDADLRRRFLSRDDVLALEETGRREAR